MKTTLFTALGAAAVGLLWASPAAAQEAEEATLKYKPIKVWNYLLPQERWSGVGDSLGIPHGDQEGFAAENTAFKLGLDTDGNGKPDHEVKGVAGYAVLKGEDAEGESFKYAVRIRKGTTWEYASSGVYSGKLHGETITLIDQNNNGVWNEVGEDAMIVGKGDAASHLSEVVNLKGALYTLSVSADGRAMSALPYAGETGTLDALDAFEAKGELLAASFSSKDGSYSFELADAKGGLLVPAGDYVLDAGFVAKKKEWVRVRRGSMRPVAVDAGRTVALEWGGPLEMKFGLTRNSDEEATVQPPSFWGAAGEEYYDFFPGGRSPEIVVVDANGKEVWSGKFCESWGGNLSPTSVPASEDDTIQMRMKRDTFGAITGEEESKEKKPGRAVTPSAS